MTSTVYSLSAADGEVRYIGVTRASLNVRLTKHCSDAKQRCSLPVHCWIVALPQRPTIKALCIVADRHAWEYERRFIAGFRKFGAALLNQTAGGRGFKGLLKRGAVWNKGKPFLQMIGNQYAAGRKSPAHAIEARAIANRESWADPERRAKRQAAIAAVNASPETKRRRSDAIKEFWRKRKEKANSAPY